ncbi:MAG: M23 family metallopeptidase [Acidimicrobiales bacterium]
MSVRWCFRQFVPVAIVAAAILGLAGGPAAAQASRFVPPVDAPISDPYRPPTTPYGPGNRGIEYSTTPGTAVRASSSGVVAFAGVIAFERYVSIDHEGGIRTTYSYLATIDVTTGQRVAQGEVVGTAGVRLHFGARRFGLYIDPASLFERAAPHRARLVPVGGSPWT